MDKITTILMNLIKCSIHKENIDVQQYCTLSQKEKNSFSSYAQSALSV